MSDYNLLVVLGATAVGKTKLAVQLARHFNGEIISADSRQVFKGMDIGTGKDLAEYETDGQKIPHHLIDIKNAGENYHVNLFKDDFYSAFADITTRGKLPILCGGTGMYIHSLLQNHTLTAVPVNLTLRNQLSEWDKNTLLDKLKEYKIEHRQQADVSSVKRLIRAIEIADYLSSNHFVFEERPMLRPLVIGLHNTLETRRNKILSRLNYRLDNGLVAEVEKLIASGVSKEMLVFYGLEYKYLVSYLNKEIDFETLKERLGIAICQYAKRQMTFFRKMEKDGILINWLSADDELSSIENKASLLVTNHFA